ncbi:uncharacterized protein Dvar_04650 [Desulfosarcina variabilis str. Montpellier]
MEGGLGGFCLFGHENEKENAKGQVTIEGSHRLKTAIIPSLLIYNFYHQRCNHPVSRLDITIMG